MNTSESPPLERWARAGLISEDQRAEITLALLGFRLGDLLSHLRPVRRALDRAEHAERHAAGVVPRETRERERKAGIVAGRVGTRLLIVVGLALLKTGGRWYVGRMTSNPAYSPCEPALG